MHYRTAGNQRRLGIQSVKNGFNEKKVDPAVRQLNLWAGPERSQAGQHKHAVRARTAKSPIGDPEGRSTSWAVHLPGASLHRKRTIAEELEMDPVSIILVGVSAVLMLALFIWSMNMLTALDARPARSDE